MARQLFYRLASTTKLYFDFKISQTKKKHQMKNKALILQLNLGMEHDRDQ